MGYYDPDGDFPIDSNGNMVNTSDSNGPFADAVELAQRLSVSADARDCVATQVFRYAIGRTESDEDACSLTQLKAGFEAADYDMRELWVAVGTTDAFRFRSLTGGGQ